MMMIHISIVPFFIAVSHFLVKGVLSTPHPILDAGGTSFRSLRAATRRSHLVQRDIGIELSYSAQLDYIDEDYDALGSIFFSQVNVESSTGFLLIEQIEHHLERVACAPSTIELQFATTSSYATSKNVMQRLVGSYIITSHVGCNDMGARVPFLVNEVSFSDDNLTVQVSAAEKPWHEAFGRFSIEYGYSKEYHEPRNHGTLYRRDSAATTTSPAALTATTIIPSTSPASTSAVLNLAYQTADSTFSLPVAVGPPLPIALGCKLCKTTGSMKLTQSKFEVDINADNVASPLDYIRTGTLELEMNDFSAYIDLQIMPSLTGSLDYTLFSVPISGFVIPKVGKAGLLFEPMLNFNWALSGGMKFSSGFDLRVPDGSNVLVNLADPNKSSVTGFDKTTLKLIPFQANISDIELDMQLSLRPRVTLAFSLAGGILLAEAGASIDLPFVNASIKQLATTHTNSNCETSDGTPVGEADFARVFRNLTHIAPVAGLGVNIDVALVADVPGLKNREFAGSKVLMSKGVPLSTACLAFQTTATAGPGFAPATAVLAEMKAQETAKGSNGGAGGGGVGGKGEGGAKKSGARRLNDFGSGRPSRWRIFGVCGVGILAAGFIST